MRRPVQKLKKKPLKPKSSKPKSRRRNLPISFELEKRFIKSALVVGADEVGRGCIAGPVCVAVQAFDSKFYESPPEWIEDVIDSKLLGPKKREQVFDLIRENSVIAETLMLPAEEVDRLNILQATRKAFSLLIFKIDQSIDCVLVDGNQTIPDIRFDQHTVVGGDRVSHSIAAASILAKVTRDRWMTEQAGRYPQYFFEKHKGYGTSLHWKALEEHGPCSLHRQSFLSRLQRKRKGSWVESMAADYLISEGFEVLERNTRTANGEIDIVARKEKRIHFVEVRERADGDLEKAFPKSKQDQVRKSARQFLAERGYQGQSEAQIDFVFVQGQELQAYWDAV